MWYQDKKLQTEFLKGEETTAERYEEMLGVLPPELMAPNGFLVGEPTDHKDGRARFAMYFERENKFFYAGLATLKDFKMMLIPC